MSVIDRRPVTKALVGWIATATAKPCGDHRLPLDLPPAPTPPQKPASYAIVYAIEGGGYWGAPLVAPELDDQPARMTKASMPRPARSRL